MGLTVTNNEAVPLRSLEWGMEYLHYDPAAPWPLILDSDSLVTSGFSGTQTTLAGSYDPNATGNNAITSVVASSYQAICGTGAQLHVGTFRVKARVNSGPAGCDSYFRLAWRVGDGSYSTNDPARLTTALQAFYAVDLGLITIPVAQMGAQAWDGRIEAYSAAGEVTTLYIDFLMLIPTGDGYGKARASYAYTPGVIVARDSFAGLGSGAALNARTPDAGAAWATSGVATDFTGDTGAISGSISPRLKRASVSEANFRWAVFGSAMTDQEVSALAWSFASPFFAPVQVVIARWVDASNHLRFQWVGSGGSGAGTLQLVKVVAGVETVLASATGSVVGALLRLRVVVFASGRAVASEAGVTLDAVDSALATGGALASGKGGIADKNLGSTPQSRFYDDVTVATPATEPIVGYAGRKVEITSADTLRESSAGGTWGRPPSYRGSRPKVQPAGVEDRTNRCVVLAHRNDLETQPWEPLEHSITLEATVTPRYSVVPR